MIDPKKVFQFSKVPSEESQNMALDLTISAGLPYFSGHFPGNPVLPAVAMIDASVEAVSTIKSGRPLFMKRLQSAKFMDLVRPGDDVRLELLVLITTGGAEKWTVQWTRDEGGQTKRLSEIIFEI